MPYADARLLIQAGDVLLYRPSRGVFGRLIARIGRGPYSHAEMAVWCHKRLLSCGSLQWRGVRAIAFSNLIQANSGQWDVFRVTPPQGESYAPALAVSHMIDILDERYGWRNLLRTAAARMCFVRLLIPPDIDDGHRSRYSPFCSQAVSRALNAGGVDPVKFCANRATGPNDLARSACLRYQLTLRY